MEEYNKMKQAIERFMNAWKTGELTCDVFNGRFWLALEMFEELQENWNQEDAYRSILEKEQLREIYKEEDKDLDKIEVDF